MILILKIIYFWVKIALYAYYYHPKKYQLYGTGIELTLDI